MPNKLKGKRIFKKKNSASDTQQNTEKTVNSLEKLCFGFDMRQYESTNKSLLNSCDRRNHSASDGYGMSRMSRKPSKTTNTIHTNVWVAYTGNNNNSRHTHTRMSLRWYGWYEVQQLCTITHTRMSIHTHSPRRSGFLVFFTVYVFIPFVSSPREWVCECVCRLFFLVYGIASSPKSSLLGSSRVAFVCVDELTWTWATHESNGETWSTTLQHINGNGWDDGIGCDRSPVHSMSSTDVYVCVSLCLHIVFVSNALFIFISSCTRVLRSSFLISTSLHLSLVHRSLQRRRQMARSFRFFFSFCDFMIATLLLLDRSTIRADFCCCSDRHRLFPLFNHFHTTHVDVHNGRCGQVCVCDRVSVSNCIFVSCLPSECVVQRIELKIVDCERKTQRDRDREREVSRVQLIFQFFSVVIRLFHFISLLLRPSDCNNSWPQK